MNGTPCAKAACLKKIGAIVGLTAVLGSGLYLGAWRVNWVPCPCTGKYYADVVPVKPAQ